MSTVSTKATPAGHHTVTPHLAIKNAVKALEFYKKAFGATEVYKLVMPGGRLGHAEIRLGDSLIMLADEFPEYGGKAPEALDGGTAPGSSKIRSDTSGGWPRTRKTSAREEVQRRAESMFAGKKSGTLRISACSHASM